MSRQNRFQHDLDAAVAEATGEDLATIRRLGFSPTNLTGDNFDPEPNWLPPSFVDWVKDNSRLLLDGEVIMQIRRPNQARNQIRILDAFQEESWPDRIDDPLPRPATGDDSRQLGEAVRRLKQGLQRITFRRDGSGEGVRWEFAPGDPPAK